jgi:signal transduction histidine kinase
MLLHGDAGEISEQQRKFISEITRANQRSVALINALLSVSRIDSGKMLASPKSTDLVTIAKNVITGIKPLSERSNIRIESIFDSKIPNITIDPEILTLALQNVLSNAVKYTPAGGKVSIKGRFCAPNICIDVRDNGIGIPKSVHDRLFSKFFRADNARSKDPDGTGLGLYIAKSAIELTGGKIAFTSKEGKGTTFTLTIPTNPPKGAENKKKPTELSTIL